MDAEVETLIARLRETQTLGKLVGGSPALLKAIRPVPLVARTDACVLILGETGTGKELVARAIHYLSPRASGPFVPVNCGSLPDTLLEDELFGHERGAFTDAHSARPGLLRQAEKGTLFLDEVDSLTPRAQVALLRLLQDRIFRALGSSGEQQADVRFLAATNTPLERLVPNGALRSDLYYRLSVVTILLPALRERREDIPLLADHFLRKHTPQGRPVPHLAADAQAVLMAFDWPGNVRELENVVLRSILLTEADAIGREDLELPFWIDSSLTDRPRPGHSSYQVRKREAVGNFEREYLTQLMNDHRGNVTQAARAVGKERRELGRLLKKHRLDRTLFKA